MRSVEQLLLELAEGQNTFTRKLTKAEEIKLSKYIAKETEKIRANWTEEDWQRQSLNKQRTRKIYDLDVSNF